MVCELPDIGCGTQLVNGFPVYPSRQVQVGVWLTTVQSALTPHEPGQGSVHFWRMHAKLLGHSALIVHSGLQLGGDPKKLSKQEQEGNPPMLRH